MNIKVSKTIFNIVVPCKSRGEKILSSTSLSAGQIKGSLNFAAQDFIVHGEINVDKWELNLGVIPAAKFDTLFISRLAQTFAGRLACEHVSIADQQALKMATSNATEPSVLLGRYHLDGEELILLARRCLSPQTFKTLLQDSPVEQLQRLLKLFLEGAWQSSKMLPVFWYTRVTADRLSLAAVMYLLKSQGGHDWLMHKHSPTASQVTGWAKAIARGEVPPEQVAQLLTGNQSSDSILPGQQPYPLLIVMRWLLPLWRQPVVRRVIHRLKGRLGVHRLDACLSRCLQCPDDIMQEEKEMQSVPEQVAPSQDNTVLSPDRGMESNSQQVALPLDSTALPQGRAVPSDTLPIALSRDNAMLPKSEEISVEARCTMQPGNGDLHSPNKSEAHSSNHGISNAGLLLLWPLLPQLFSLLGLWEKMQFVSNAARWQAVYSLDRLVWGEVSLAEGRLTLNQMLCGVSGSTSVPPPTPLSLLQLQQIDGWLTAIGQQLACWQKLSLTNIRQLFLQRVGKISTEGTVPQIDVWPEPYDFLLRDWPWPMTLASFPWTEQPLTIVWPLNSVTG